jgi:hypothetical protein
MIIPMGILGILLILTLIWGVGLLIMPLINKRHIDYALEEL